MSETYAENVRNKEGDLIDLIMAYISCEIEHNDRDIDCVKSIIDTFKGNANVILNNTIVNIINTEANDINVIKC